MNRWSFSADTFSFMLLCLKGSCIVSLVVGDKVDHLYLLASLGVCGNSEIDVCL